MIQNLTILVADDWPDAAESLGKLLQFQGHSVRIARDGAEAMQIAQEVEPDVMLLDLAMPKMTGADVARAVAATSDRKPLLIAISGCCSREDKDRASKAGFDHFFSKPIDTGALLRTLNAHARNVFISMAEERTSADGDFCASESAVNC